MSGIAGLRRVNVWIGDALIGNSGGFRPHTNAEDSGSDSFYMFDEVPNLLGGFFGGGGHTLAAGARARGQGRPWDAIMSAPETAKLRGEGRWFQQPYYTKHGIKKYSRTWGKYRLARAISASTLAGLRTR